MCFKMFDKKNPCQNEFAIAKHIKLVTLLEMNSWQI